MEESEKISREMVEEAGKLFEKFGLTPMQGRIVAYFTISDPPEKTFEELVEYFKASKSSVSNSLNFLLSNKIIDYKTFVADRKRYFFITDSFFRVYFEKVLENVSELKELTLKTVSLRSPHHPEASTVILKWIENANLFQDTIGKAMAQLKKESV
jgi:DNA-binding transcriptional regulator GbsR (MarR family)